MNEKMTAEKAIEQLNSLMKDRESHVHRDDFDEVFLQDIEALKVAIQVLENQPKEKTGKWQEAYNPNESPFFQRKFYCSCCREWNTYGKTVYCMNCGAKMEV